MKNKNKSYAAAYLGLAILGFLLPIAKFSKEVPVREITITLYNEFMSVVTLSYGLGISGFVEGIAITLAFITCIVLTAKCIFDKNFNKKLMVMLYGIWILLIIIYTVSCNMYADLIIGTDKDLIFRYHIGYYLMIFGAIMSMGYNIKGEKKNY